MLNVHIHLGAHKTASTFIQEQLRYNKDTLKNEGIYYVPLWVTRGQFLQKFHAIVKNEDNVDNDVYTELRRQIFKEVEVTVPQSKLHTIIISDENILGGLGLLARTGEMYTNIEKRISIVKRIFDGDNVKIFFSIRDYNSFYASAYSEAFRSSDYRKDFESFTNHLKILNNSWLNIINCLSNNFDKENIWLWKYEDFKNNEHTIIKKIINTNNDLIIHTDQTIRKSLPPKGIQVIRKCTSILSKNEVKKLMEYLANDFDFDNKYEKLIIQDVNIKNNLEKQYKSEVNMLLDGNYQFII
jgi:mRNA-degrading endonuclease YafQ of YafQ-DinJ toxin-antitoxin module